MFCETRGGGGGGGGFWARGKFFWMFFFSTAHPPPPPPNHMTFFFWSLSYNQNIIYRVLEPKVFSKSTQFKSSAITTVNNFALLFLTVRSKQSRIGGALRSKIYFCRFVFSQATFGLFCVFFADLICGTDVLSLALWLASSNVNDSYCSYF